MATASSAQREPSMEEILASIRRIIEDSDTGRKPAQDLSEIQLASEADVSPVAVVETTSPEVAAFRSELRAEPQAPKPIITLADVQAQLVTAVAEPERPAAPVITLAEVGARTITERPQADESPAAEAEVAETVPASWLREVEHEPVGEPARVETFAVRGGEDDVAREPARIAAARQHVEHLSSVETAPLRPSLISEQASRQVAASFEELSEAFASRGKKSFDDMADEMLQPMLQDWLDNNLPILVERLVREEIERIARGA